MLIKLKLRNFLSFKDASVTLGKLNIVVGANASGKTNLLKSLELLSSLARLGYPHVEGYAALSAGGGWYLNLGGLAHNFDASAGVVVGVDALVEGAVVSYTVRISADSFEEEVARGREILMRASSKERSFTYAARDGSPRTVDRLAAASLDVLYYDLRGDKRIQRVNVYPSALAHVPADAHPALRGLTELLRGVKVLHPDLATLRLRSSVRDQPETGYRGEGLARPLLQLCLERRKEYEVIERTVRGLLPDLDAIVPRIEGEEVEIQMRINGLPRPLTAAGIPDGALRLTCFTAALQSGCTLVAFEAPECFLHPRQLELLVALVKLAEPQIIFTTYSPQLLDFFRPEEVVVVSRVDAASKAERLVESEKYKIVREFLEAGGSLSEAWLTGLF
ncbi:MAG: AAA family ATPase [Thermofilum sp.]